MTPEHAVWASIAVAALSAIGGLIGGVAAYRTVAKRTKREHEDITCSRMKRLFETAFDGKIIVNRDMLIVAANRQARAITGYGDLVGRTIYDVIPSRFHDRHREHVQKYMNDPHPRKMGAVDMELWLMDRYQIEKRVRLSLSPSEDEYGEIEVAVAIQVVQD